MQQRKRASTWPGGIYNHFWLDRHRHTYIGYRTDFTTSPAHPTNLRFIGVVPAPHPPSTTGVSFSQWPFLTFHLQEAQSPAFTECVPLTIGGRQACPLFLWSTLKLSSDSEEWCLAWWLSGVCSLQMTTPQKNKLLPGWGGSIKMTWWSRLGMQVISYCPY